MKGLLLVRTGPRAPATFKLDRPVMTIGREADSDIPVPSAEVSRHHARIVFENGAYHVEDLKSLNGTFINTIPVGREPLSHLDVITVGKTNDLIFLERPAGRAAQEAITDVLRAVLHPAAGGDPIVIAQAAATLGRMAPCDVILANPAVSKRHARIERQGSRLVLTDLGSANGTFVNEERITSRDLRAGDRISFARSGDFVVHIVRESGEDELVESQPAPAMDDGGGKTQAAWTISEARERQMRIDAMAATRGAVPPPTAKPAAPPPPPSSPSPSPSGSAPTRVATPEEVKKALAGNEPPPTVAAPASPSGSAPTRIATPEEVKKALAGKEPPPTVAAPASPSGSARTRVATPEEVKRALAGEEAPPTEAAPPSPPAPPPREPYTDIPPTEAMEAFDESQLQPPAPEPPAERTVTLVPEEEGGVPVTFSVGEARKMLGRTATAPIRIDDSRISRRHANFRFDGVSVILADEGSANGTFVNGRRVQGSDGKEVKDGDVVKFGAVAFRVKLGDGGPAEGSS